MASSDIDALFTNISLDKTIDICVKKLFQTLATKELFFSFNNKFYIQVDNVAMGSPLGSTLANIFLSHHEENWLNKCFIRFKINFILKSL